MPEGQPKKKPAAPVGGSPKLNLRSRASSELDIRGYETLEGTYYCTPVCEPSLTGGTPWGIIKIQSITVKFLSY